MKRGAGSIVAAALVAAFCTGTTLPARAGDAWRTPIVEQVQSELRSAQIFRRDRDLRGRERHIQQFRETPARRDNDRFLRERREKPRDSEQDRALDAVRRGAVLPLDTIIGSVQRYCPGTFLDATLRQRGNQFAYRMSILRPSGRRVTLLVDAQSGVVLRGRCD